MRWIFITIFSLTGATVAILGFRGQFSPDPPRIFFWDMKYQPKYMPQAESTFFADRRTLRSPVAETVAYAGTDWFSDAGFLTEPHPEFLREDEAFYLGNENGQVLPRLPQRAVDEAGGWRELLIRGQQQFNIHCSVCHGRAGDGRGVTTVYGMVGVASYHDDRLRRVPDGELYQVIVNGKNLMPAYGHQVPEALDRWAVVGYVRVLQASQFAEADEVPEQVNSE